MASGIFEFFKAESMRDNLDASMAAGTVKAYAFDAGAHTIDFTNDKLLADITAGALEGSAVTLTNVTVADTGV
ncbi:MAG: hypothetical protein GWN13_02020, partial [Phycisphaerae bacterium]|nr:hypothetical protein [Phycisphaerae bacterium]